jgi:hypothetical protein
MKKLLLGFVMMCCVGSAWTADTPALAPTASIKGKVLEVLDAGSFVYLRLQTKDGETWAVVATAPVEKGTEVTIDNVTAMTNFESKKLNRRFDQIVFGSIAGAAAGPDMAAMHAGIATTADAGDVKVAKAAGPNARTVAEIVSGSRLEDKVVEVHGKVVKSRAGCSERTGSTCGTGRVPPRTAAMTYSSRRRTRRRSGMSCWCKVSCTSIGTLVPAILTRS